MTVRPILFSGSEIRALLDGRKTQTRRVIKARMGRHNYLPEFCGGRYDDKNDPECWGWEDTDRGEWITLDQFRHYNFVPYAVGDRLWVRETWSGPYAWKDMKPSDRGRCGAPAACEAWYWSDGEPCRGDWERPRPATQMPRWASRLTLVVTDARVQRVQEISAEDCAREGVKISDIALTNKGYIWGNREAFRDLWNSLHGHDAWERNNWVAAYTFTVHRCNVDQIGGGE